MATNNNSDGGGQRPSGLMVVEAQATSAWEANKLANRRSKKTKRLNNLGSSKSSVRAPRAKKVLRRSNDRADNPITRMVNQLMASQELVPTLTLSTNELFPLSLEQSDLRSLYLNSGQKVSWDFLAQPVIIDARMADQIEGALSQLQQAHAVLRTSFSVDDGRVMQRVAASMPLDISYHRAPIGLPARTAIAFHQNALLKSKLSLNSARLWRVRVVRYGDQCAVLMMFCSLIIDEDSTRKLIAQFNDLLRTDGLLADLQSRAQYRDYVYWQASQQDSTFWQASANWYVSQLKPILSSPGKTTPVEELTGRAELYEQFLPIELIERLNLVASNYGVTTLAIMLSTFSQILVRFFQSDDVVVATRLNFKQADLSPEVLGQFAREVPLVFPVNQSIDDWIQTERKIQLAQSKSAISDGYLCRALADEHIDSLAAFRYVFYAAQDISLITPSDSMFRATDFTKPRIQQKTYQSAYIQVRLEEHEGTVRAKWIVRKDKFERNSIKKLMGAYAQQLRRVAAGL